MVDYGWLRYINAKINIINPKIKHLIILIVNDQIY